MLIIKSRSPTELRKGELSGGAHGALVPLPGLQPEGSQGCSQASRPHPTGAQSTPVSDTLLFAGHLTRDCALFSVEAVDCWEINILITGTLFLIYFI